MNYEAIKPLLFKLQPETAHCLSEWSLRALNAFCPWFFSVLARCYVVENESLKQNILGLDFHNPVGLAGGFDKNATMLRPLSAFGFGFLEFGTFTLKMQKGNEKPRLFRLEKEESLQNAMGFNNEGVEKISSRLAKIYPFVLPLGANIGKNKDTANEKALEEYLALVQQCQFFCDYFTINISSPNTQALRELQDNEFLSTFLSKAREITQKPLFIKIAPDMQIEQALDLCENAMNKGASGFVIANTSTDYSLLKNQRAFGGISGRLIAPKNQQFFKELAKVLFGKTLLIASGGINSAQSAYERIKDGANLIQIYTALVYKGPKLVYDINEGLISLLKKDQCSHLSQAVGVNIQ
ncbi:quinone-dependent dihydroorotate dehydrogenase [Campylobacter sp. MIT 21-1685]|uniref:quinone-dependent dihydroorotate dehydrogenase n=1 Tax=unclassified Campylobacter TaxID=2593542 RepID=UPI00224A7A86|nr:MULTISPECIES: quinone-dependent dihydroorotate dehydrogenase [unclassified Campylobacter]MCX2683593.1 quinone-dependent dihydroorotate dehydrogenase [Campylobacter sp. MIT 21-1684]MCX2751876.1 quinone-dependent dihydroorotate dehydrogenase [Campylobacter sp. MIT 21-1682]MCX2808071.1 quinone-dependent dihydroorotate dehydrogenase [Campylobacter sp. MIT 21-1685]